MELKSLINQMGTNNVELDEKEINISSILNEKKYDLLEKYLFDNNIKTTNDLKKLSLSDYNKLKMGIPSLTGVGEEKTTLFIKKIDYIRMTKNSLYNQRLLQGMKSQKSPQVQHIGKIRSSANVFIELNFIKYENGNEYLDIRKVKNDGTRGKGISIKKELVGNFIDIVKNINYSDTMICNNITETKKMSDNNNKKSLKEMILNNEKQLNYRFYNEYGQSINLFIQKIKSLPNDGDIVKFLNNQSILDIKKEQYKLIHNNGLKTAVDIMNEYDKTNIKYTNINDLKIGSLVNTMTICAIANNFNQMMGMYYNKKDDILILKGQTTEGEYDDKWLNNKKIIYFLQNESEEKYKYLEFVHKPNQICRDIILGYNKHTKVYLFERSSKKEDYKYCGEFIPIEFQNSNKCILLQEKNECVVL